MLFLFCILILQAQNPSLRWFNLVCQNVQVYLGLGILKPGFQSRPVCIVFGIRLWCMTWCSLPSKPITDIRVAFNTSNSYLLVILFTLWIWQCKLFLLKVSLKIIRVRHAVEWINICRLNCVNIVLFVYLIWCMMLLSKYPNGESDSAFIFICEHPRQLVVKLPLRGKHKICE